jgi:hypothetical protein
MRMLKRAESPSAAAVEPRGSRVASKLAVFIVESLREDDELKERQEGSFLSHILRLEGKETIYRYVRTKKQLAGAFEEFSDSNFRYLHVSCHGDETGIELSSGEQPSMQELCRMLRPHLAKRRVFFSACGLVTKKFAAELLPGSKCYSVIGPSDTLSFGEAAIFWASFYHLMTKGKLRNNRYVRPKSMKQRTIAPRVTQLSSLFDVEMKYFCASRKFGYREVAEEA